MSSEIRPSLNSVTLVAYRKGYRVLPDGSVESANNRIIKLRTEGRYPYKVFTIFIPGKHNAPVKVHQLAALQKFGEEAFLSAECVRHLNGNSLDNRPENIALGTRRDNAMDRSKEDRQKHAGLAAINNVRTDWPTIDKDRLSGTSYKQLRAKYDVPLSTLSYRYGNGKRKSKKMERRKHEDESKTGEVKSSSS